MSNCETKGQRQMPISQKDKVLTSRYFKPKCLEAPITGASKLFVHTSSDTELMKSMMSSYDRLLLVKALMSSSV